MLKMSGVIELITIGIYLYAGIVIFVEILFRWYYV